MQSLQKWHIVAVCEAFVAVVSNIVVLEIQPLEILHSSSRKDLNASITELIFLNIELFKVSKPIRVIQIQTFTYLVMGQIQFLKVI